MPLDPQIVDDPNGWIEVVYGEKAHVAFGCSVVAHPGSEVFVEGGARVHAYPLARIHLLDVEAICCFDGNADEQVEGPGFRMKHRPGRECPPRIVRHR